MHFYLFYHFQTSNVSYCKNGKKYFYNINISTTTCFVRSLQTSRTKADVLSVGVWPINYVRDLD